MRTYSNILKPEPVTASRDVRAGFLGEMPSKNKALFLLSAILLVGCGTVDEGHRGVKLVWGAAQGTTLEPGLHGYNPFSTDIEEVDVKEKKFEQATEASTKDQQVVETTVAVNYIPDPEKIVEIYSKIGRNSESWEPTILAPHIQEVLKSVTAQYTALELITKRPEVKMKITEELTARISVSNFTVTQVSVTDFKFSPVYRASIEAKQVAEQDAQRAQNELERNALDVQKVEQAASSAKAAAILKAEGEAESLRIRAEAAAAFHKKVSAAATSQSLRHLEIETWNGVTPLYVSEAGMLLPSAK